MKRFIKRLRYKKLIKIIILNTIIIFLTKKIIIKVLILIKLKKYNNNQFSKLNNLILIYRKLTFNLLQKSVKIYSYLKMQKIIKILTRILLKNLSILNYKKRIYFLEKIKLAMKHKNKVLINFLEVNFIE